MIPKQRRRFGLLRSLLALLVIVLLSVFLNDWLHERHTLSAAGAALTVQDGDSFAIGKQRLRLNGIDAPEYRQNCQDSTGIEWECGKAARANLERLLREPGLVCEYEVADKYGRALASCRTASRVDVAAVQVADGFAVSHEYYGVRDYPDEEDAARASRRGIWQGDFELPATWRSLRATGSNNL